MDALSREHTVVESLIGEVPGVRVGPPCTGAARTRAHSQPDEDSGSLGRGAGSTASLEESATDKGCGGG